MYEFHDLLEERPAKQGRLFIVSTPIGNKDDISFRAVKVLRDSDIVVCEDPKVGTRLLHSYNINKKIDLLNEQNEAEKTQEYVSMMFQGSHIALISDCGTPVFADPGADLVGAAIRNNIPIEVVPGASSIMAGLVRCGFPITEFLFAGFLNREKDRRNQELKKLSLEPRTVVLLETPYRLMPVLEAAADIMPERQAYLGCNLTMGYETNHYGSFSELFKKFKDLKFKGEFVIVFEGTNEDKRQLHPRKQEFRKAPHFEKNLDRPQEKKFERKFERQHDSTQDTQDHTGDNQSEAADKKRNDFKNKKFRHKNKNFRPRQERHDRGEGPEQSGERHGTKSGE